MGRILSIDYGLKRSGIAMSDPNKILASAYKVVIGQDGLKKELDYIINNYDIEKILMGLSYKTGEVIGEIGKISIKFSKYVKSKYNLEVEFIDEAMTSKNVTEFLKKMGKNIKKYKNEIDKYSAELILEDYLKNLR